MGSSGRGRRSRVGGGGRRGRAARSLRNGLRVMPSAVRVSDLRFYYVLCFFFSFPQLSPLQFIFIKTARINFLVACSWLKPFYNALFPNLSTPQTFSSSSSPPHSNPPIFFTASHCFHQTHLDSKSHRPNSAIKFTNLRLHHCA